MQTDLQMHCGFYYCQSDYTENSKVYFLILYNAIVTKLSRPLETFGFDSLFQYFLLSYLTQVTAALE